MKTMPLLLLMCPAVLLGDTVVLKTGERVVGKVVEHGDYLLVGVKPNEAPRILDRILVESVDPKPPVEMECFLDLPSVEEDPNAPEPRGIRFYPGAKAKVRHLLDLSTRTILDSRDPATTAKRAREALKGMKGKETEEELLAALVPVCDAQRVTLALECLEGTESKALDRRLVDLALTGDQQLCKVVAGEMKRRYGKSPASILGALISRESGVKATRAAADVVGVIRDEAGIQALATAILTRGMRKSPLPHMAYVKTQRSDENTTRHEVTWLDEEKAFQEPDERILYHLVAVLEAVTKEHFKDLQDVEDWQKESEGRK